MEEIEAQLLQRVPTATIPGAPFVVRRVLAMNVLGGAAIGAAPAAPGDRDGQAAAPDDGAKQVILEVLRRTALAGATAAQIVTAANMAEERVNVLLGELVADGRTTVICKPPAYLDSDTAADVLRRVIERLEVCQLERPWLMGLTSLALARALTVPEPALVRALGAYVDTGSLAYRSGYYATPDFRPRLAADQRAFFDAAFGGQTNAGPVPVAVDRLRSLMKASTTAELAPALETLFAGGALIKVGDYVYRGSHILAIQAKLESALHQSGQISVAQFRDLTGTSRKYAVPLIEFFDAAGVTIRSGDIRVLRQASTLKL